MILELQNQNNAEDLLPTVRVDLSEVTSQPQISESLPAALRIKQEVYDASLSLLQPGPMERLSVNYDHDYKYEEEHFPNHDTKAYAIRACVTTYLITNNSQLKEYARVVPVYERAFRDHNNGHLPGDLLTLEAKDYLRFGCPSMKARVKRLLCSFWQVLRHHAYTFMSPDDLDAFLISVFDLPPPPEDLIHRLLAEFPLPKGANENYPFIVGWARKQASRLTTSNSSSVIRIATIKPISVSTGGNEDKDESGYMLDVDRGTQSMPLVKNRRARSKTITGRHIKGHQKGVYTAPLRSSPPTPSAPYDDSDDDGPQLIVLSPTKQAKRPKRATGRMLNQPNVEEHNLIWSNVEAAILSEETNEKTSVSAVSFTT